ncbi:MAG: hypothetical protein BWK76_08170 [Desulfobulbaceae bacterium A2]|nr:MAG: hypothetical protein BWK76_08170 [Desulfobulbaceae bacterium A2]
MILPRNITWQAAESLGGSDIADFSPDLLEQHGFLLGNTISLAVPGKPSQGCRLTLGWADPDSQPPDNTILVGPECYVLLEALLKSLPADVKGLEMHCPPSWSADGTDAALLVESPTDAPPPQFWEQAERWLRDRGMNCNMEYHRHDGGRIQLVSPQTFSWMSLTREILATMPKFFVQDWDNRLEAWAGFRHLQEELTTIHGRIALEEQRHHDLVAEGQRRASALRATHIPHAETLRDLAIPLTGCQQNLAAMRDSWDTLAAAWEKITEYAEYRRPDGTSAARKTLQQEFIDCLKSCQTEPAADAGTPHQGQTTWEPARGLDSMPERLNQIEAQSNGARQLPPGLGPAPHQSLPATVPRDLAADTDSLSTRLAELQTRLTTTGQRSTDLRRQWATPLEQLDTELQTMRVAMKNAGTTAVAEVQTGIDVMLAKPRDWHESLPDLRRIFTVVSRQWQEFVNTPTSTTCVLRQAQNLRQAMGVIIAAEKRVRQKRLDAIEPKSTAPERNTVPLF